MDSLHAIGFYVSAAISLGGGLLVAFLPGRGSRGVALATAGLGVAGVYASLSAGFAGLVALVCYAGCALLIAAPHYRVMDTAVSNVWRQVGAVAAGGLFAVLAYAAWRGDFVHATLFYLGAVKQRLGRQAPFARDPSRPVAVGALILVALVERRRCGASESAGDDRGSRQRSLRRRGPGRCGRFHRRLEEDVTAALAGLPLMFGGASRFRGLIAVRGAGRTASLRPGGGGLACGGRACAGCSRSGDRGVGGPSR